MFRVADRGPGVARVERDRIFEAFYRPKNQAPDGGHAGLGLSIARKLAELQGGSLAYHPRDGGGSVFALSLPAADVDIDAADAFVQPSPGNREESNGGVRGSSDDHWSRAPAERPA